MSEITLGTSQKIWNIDYYNLFQTTPIKIDKEGSNGVNEDSDDDNN